MNTIQLIGRLTKDVELKTTQNGKAVVINSLAVKRPFTKDTTDFITIVAWEQRANFLATYAKKGNRVGVNGYLTVREYEDKNGNKRSAYEVNATEVELLEGKAEQPTQMEQLREDEELPF